MGTGHLIIRIKMTINRTLGKAVCAPYSEDILMFIFKVSSRKFTLAEAIRCGKLHKIVNTDSVFWSQLFSVFV